MNAFKRFAPIVIRVLFGLIFFVFGLNGFLNFIPKPPGPMPEKALSFITLFGSSYLMHFVKGVETICGALILTNRFVPLALAVIAPIVVNIVAFHTLLEPSGAGFAIFILLMGLYLAWTYRAAYKPMLGAKNAQT